MHHATFTKPFIDFVNKEFDSKSHIFLITSNTKMDFVYDKYQNVFFIKNSRFMFLNYRKNLLSAKKIIIHGLFNINLLTTLNIFTGVLKDVYWVIWGGDLYISKRQKNIKRKLDYLLRKRVIKKIGHIITYIKGDYDLAVNLFNSKAKLHYCLMYQSNLYKNFDLDRIKKDSNQINILVGHSAIRQNNHFKIFDKLLPMKDINIYAPLSYGDEKYKDLVIEYGFKNLGDRFIPILDFMEFNEYIGFLSTIDVAIFDSNRQHAMGNIITLLGMGKKVYIRKEVSTSMMFKNLKVKIYDSESINIHTIKDDLDNGRNVSIIEENFSFNRFKSNWKSIFYGDKNE